jgi:hypothetical protein
MALLDLQLCEFEMHSAHLLSSEHGATAVATTMGRFGGHVCSVWLRQNVVSATTLPQGVDFALAVPNQTDGGCTRAIRRRADPQTAAAQPIPVRIRRVGHRAMPDVR